MNQTGYKSIKDFLQKRKSPASDATSPPEKKEEVVEATKEERMVPFGDQIPDSWQKLLAEDLNQVEVQTLAEKVAREYEQGRVFPPSDKIFRALSLCPVDKVQVVILGQGIIALRTLSTCLVFCWFS